MVAPRLLTPRQFIVKSGTYIVIESIAGATLTCGSQSYTLGSGETLHAFEVTAGTYACTANKTDYYEATASVTITSGFEYVTLIPTNIPTSYQEVEYLRADGTQYIATNVTNAENQIIRVKCELDQILTQRILSTENLETSLVFLSATYGGGGKYYSVCNNVADLSQVAEATEPRIGVNAPYNIVITNSSVISFNGVNYNTLSYGGATTSSYIQVFGRSNENVNRFHGAIYALTIEQSGVNIINLIPCYRKSDSVAGMYDKVTDTFLTNSGTGSFTVGADVN